MNLQDLADSRTLANLRSQGLKTKDIRKLRFVLTFCETAGVDCKINWIPTREYVWTVSPSVEIIALGTRAALTGWGLSLKEAVNGAYDKIRSGGILANMDTNDRRLWRWSQDAEKFNQLA